LSLSPAEELTDLTFEEQLDPVYPEMVRFARSLAGSATDGDDLLQDSLVRAWQAHSQLRDKRRFRFWMLRIISNTFRSKLRRQRIKSWLSLDLIRNVPEPARLAYEDKELVRQALANLHREYREAIILFEVLGLSVAEVTVVQKASASAVKSRLARGRRMLREQYFRLAGREGDHEVKIVTSNG